ncbi:hypothetical protein J6590_099423 [Homalodisca vitripennis]|nr:hypothetical protein J6590_099423 [Homalodisca vitripennis]
MCFDLQKKAIRTTAEIGIRQSSSTCTRQSLYYLYKCEVTRGRDVHEYDTRGRDAFRSAQHRLQAYEALPSENGAKLFNKLPLDLRVENRKPLFKRNLRRLLVQGTTNLLMSLRQ